MEMTEENKEVNIYTHFFNNSFSKLQAERISPEEIVIALKDGSHHKIPFDVRDRRALFIFDGDIPCGGLPRNGTQVSILSEQHMPVRPGNKRLKREYELPYPYDGIVRRRVVLLPVGSKTVIVRYRPISMAVWYSIVRVSRHNQEVSVQLNNCT